MISRAGFAWPVRFLLRQRSLSQHFVAVLSPRPIWMESSRRLIGMAKFRREVANADQSVGEKPNESHLDHPDGPRQRWGDGSGRGHDQSVEPGDLQQFSGNYRNGRRHI